MESLKSNEEIIREWLPTEFISPKVLKAMKEAQEQAIDKCVEIARYKGGLTKAETWSLGKDEIHDRIEELIFKFKEELK